MRSVLFLCLILGSSALSTDQMNTVKDAINQLITDNGVTANGRTNFPNIATIVRLAFHDCNGGCDGCVDMSNPSNAGLQTIIDDLDDLFEQANVVGSSTIASLMSKADFYALAGITAVERGAENQRRCGRDCTPPQPTLVFKTGRTDAADCENNPPRRTFPDAHDGNAETLQFFADEFSFSADETVALLGAHTLGRASGANSGFRGPWVQAQDRLDNEYYSDLVDAGLNWGQVDVGGRRTGSRFQWNHNGVRGGPMMLNADMCLLKDIDVNADGSVTSCTYSTCANSGTATMVQQYATDNAGWISDFSAVFQKMVDHTSSTLTVVDNTKREMADVLLNMLRSLLHDQ